MRESVFIRHFLLGSAVALLCGAQWILGEAQSLFANASQAAQEVPAPARIYWVCDGSIGGTRGDANPSSIHVITKVFSTPNNNGHSLSIFSASFRKWLKDNYSARFDESRAEVAAGAGCFGFTQEGEALTKFAYFKHNYRPPQNTRAEFVDWTPESAK